MMTKAMSPWELLDVALKEIELIDIDTALDVLQNILNSYCTSNPDANIINI